MDDIFVNEFLGRIKSTRGAEDEISPDDWDYLLGLLYRTSAGEKLPYGFLGKTAICAGLTTSQMDDKWSNWKKAQQGGSKVKRARRRKVLLPIPIRKISWNRPKRRGPQLQ
jgi:hypothetical protein